MREPFGGWERGLSPASINNFRQNSPELVVDDARRMLGLDPEQCATLRQILLARGINKWLKARRDIIRLKHDVKGQIKVLLADYQRWNPAHKAMLKALMFWRERLRAICHQPRWVEWPRLRTASKCDGRFVVKSKGASGA